MEEKYGETVSHNITIHDRKTMALTGVQDVLSFDASEILMETVLGVLMLRGRDLHVKQLSVDKGEVEIDGEIQSFAYADEQEVHKTGSVLKRLFQ